jgi:hypothetical protein
MHRQEPLPHVNKAGEAVEKYFTDRRAAAEAKLQLIVARAHNPEPKDAADAINAIAVLGGDAQEKFVKHTRDFVRVLNCRAEIEQLALDEADQGEKFKAAQTELREFTATGTYNVWQANGLREAFQAVTHQANTIQRRKLARELEIRQLIPNDIRHPVRIAMSLNGLDDQGRPIAPPAETASPATAATAGASA